MSSFSTHALIGGCAGAIAGIGLERFQPDLLATAADSIPGGTPAMAQLALVAVSAVVALIPDIDEPGSWISRRTVAVIALAGMALGALAGSLFSLVWLIVGIGIGAVVGSLLGAALVRGIRLAAGGHRRLTHSLVLAAAFVALGIGVMTTVDPRWAVIPFALAWGIVMHDLGDVVTPAGVPLLYPLSSKDVRLLPEPICRAGEFIAGATAVLLLAGAAWLNGAF